MTFEESSRPLSHRTNSNIGVLVIHGYTSTPRSMINPANAFIEAGYNVELPLLPGHGTKLEDMNKIKYPQWIETVETAYLDLSSRCKKVFIFGLSLGGALALYLAEYYPEISGIILVNNALYMKSFESKFAWIAKYFISSVPGISNDIKKEGVIEQAYSRNPASAGHEAIKMLKLIKDNLYKVKSPAIIFKSIEDHVIPVEVAEYTYEGIESVDKKLIFLNNSYHVATLDNDSPVINSVSLQFIKERMI